MAIKQFASETLRKLKQHGDNAVQRSMDRHIKLAVTGLSRAGKSAFITALVQNLLDDATTENLPFFDVVQQNRLIAVRKTRQGNLHIPSFDYVGATQQLNNGQWPDSTRHMSELRIELKYRTEHSVLSQINPDSKLTIDLFDYPGEWLMDLPLLTMDFEQWCAFTNALNQQEPRAEYIKALTDKIALLEVNQAADEAVLADLATEYQQILTCYKEKLGLSLVQPGRFILPGELEGAPLLQFIPLTAEQLQQVEEEPAADSYYSVIKERYDAYKHQVVQPFYQDYFKRFDRQIILVDCLTALSDGKQAFTELQRAISLLLQSFNYGKSGLLGRLFAPKIDKLLFAASKVDHVTPDQHANIVTLLNTLIKQAQQDIAFEGADVEVMALAAHCATQAGSIVQHGQEFPCIQGEILHINATDDAQTEDIATVTTDTNVSRQRVTLYPGDVPTRIPSAQFWEQHQFEFQSFLPPLQITPPSKHIRLDHALQYLLGDKLG